MAKQYLRELDRLNDVYKRGIELDISQLSTFLATMANSPAAMIGSGGSLSTAALAAELHERFFASPARAVSPLEVLSKPSIRTASICFSASGRNRDIGSAFRALCKSEAGPLGALVMAKDTPLHALGAQYERTKIISIDGGELRDGFLAVASLVMSSVALLRSFAEVAGQDDELPPSLEALLENCLGSSSLLELVTQSRHVIGRETTSLLYSPLMKPAAIDLESRFVEAALGNLHIADLRNFGHGRHHWLAKRSQSSGVIALVDSEWSTLGRRTLSLIPDHIPTHCFEVSGPPSHQSMIGILIGLYLAQVAGELSGIDPGKPGVPEFGRKLYRLGPGRVRAKQQDNNRMAAIRRKAPCEDLRIVDSLITWNDAYETIWNDIQSKTLRGVVLDYDGTLCRSEERFDPLRPDVAEALERLVRANFPIGIATGRGPSAGFALRQALPEDLWPLITMGYYNGAVITALSNDKDPIIEINSEDALRDAVERHIDFGKYEVRPNSVQISVRHSPNIDRAHAAASMKRLADQVGEKVEIVSSGHSLDVLRAGQTKNSVTEAILKGSGTRSGTVLRIGDKGGSLGNDYNFLNCKEGLSVDEVSSHLEHCWNLAPAGILGVQATIYYLQALQVKEGVAHLKFGRGDRGVKRAT